TGIRVSPDFSEGAVLFGVGGEGGIELVARLDGEVVGTWSGRAGDGRMQLDAVAPWSPDSPVLYDLEIRLLGLDGVEADRDEGYFPGGGMTAARDEDLRRDVELAKAFGFNGARKHQKAEDPRWLYWADRLGFLVWSEMPSFHEHSLEAERRLAAEWSELVRRDRDHPSIVAWVVANESFGLDHIDPSVRARFLDDLSH